MSKRKDYDIKIGWIFFWLMLAVLIISPMLSHYKLENDMELKVNCMKKTHNKQLCKCVKNSNATHLCVVKYGSY